MTLAGRATCRCTIRRCLPSDFTLHQDFTITVNSIGYSTQGHDNVKDTDMAYTT